MTYPPVLGLRRRNCPALVLPVALLWIGSCATASMSSPAVTIVAAKICISSCPILQAEEMLGKLLYLNGARILHAPQEGIVKFIVHHLPQPLIVNHYVVSCQHMDGSPC